MKDFLDVDYEMYTLCSQHLRNYSFLIFHSSLNTSYLTTSKIDITYMRNIFFLLLCLGMLGFASKKPEEAKNYPQDYFRSPIDQPIRLSGTFGELRPNHLHSGIDIKASNGKVGQPIFAVADGYIARIKVTAAGYGNALYIVHPKGYMTVYAHLHNFSKEVAAYVKKQQYEKKSYNVDLYLGPETFKVDKGEQIGKLGTSGRSFGPHLHFEIRDNKTQKPINPLLFGLKMEDNIAPKMHELKVYYLNDKKEALTTKTLKLIKEGNRYRIKGDTITIGAWRAGFGLKVYDHHDGVSNWNGIYALDMYKEEVLEHSFEMETFAFSESRYINCHLDYEEQVTNKAYFNRCYPLPGNKLKIYNKKEGIIALQKNKALPIKMVAKDVDGNKAIVEFWVKRGEVTPPESRNYNYALTWNEPNEIDAGNIQVNFPKGVFYENAYLKYEVQSDNSDDVYSSMYSIGKRTIPVHKYFTIAIKPDQLPERLRKKAIIAYCEGDKVVSQGGKWKDGWLSTKVRSLGNYCVMADDVPPTIEKISFKKDLRGASKISFKIKDSMPTGGKAKGLSYKGYIDGEWVLMEYDEKKDRLNHYFDSRTGKGEHVFKLVVKDDRGNETVFQDLFIR